MEQTSKHAATMRYGATFLDKGWPTVGMARCSKHMNRQTNKQTHIRKQAMRYGGTCLDKGWLIVGVKVINKI